MNCENTKKPCIECGEECDIFCIQSSDLFTLCYLRICSAECMFIIAYEFMQENCIHHLFRNKLNELQNEEDKKLKDDRIKEITDESMKNIEKAFRSNAYFWNLGPNRIAEILGNPKAIQKEIENE